MTTEGHVPDSPGAVTDVRVGLHPATIAQAFRDNLACLQARFPAVATKYDYSMALAYTIRDRLLQRQIRTAHGYFQQRSRSTCYLSAEFLLGPRLGNNLVNLGIYEQAKEGMKLAGCLEPGNASAGRRRGGA